MAKTYNGRFEIPKKPGKGTGWLILGVVLMFGGLTGVVLGCLSLYKYKNCRNEYKLFERFLEYCVVIGMKQRVSIRDLAKAQERSVSDVRRDLNRMIAKGYFGESASMDVNGGYLVLPRVQGLSGQAGECAAGLCHGQPV